MTHPIQFTQDRAVSDILADLRRTFQGEIRSDRLYRALYATDASIYQIVPDAVLLPRGIEDVQQAVRACARYGVPITPRGAGTGLTGGAVNHGLQLDCSRHLNHILEIDPQRRIAVVESGVVLDHLNAAVKPAGLHFAPDVAPSSRATIGGMIANNSCGAHSVIFGRTVDHVLALHVVLSDGSDVSWGESDAIAATMPHSRGRLCSIKSDLAQQCEAALAAVARDHAPEIQRRFPKILRSNGGYALDRLKIDAGRLNVETIICGSEGTLGIVVGAVLKLTPLPTHRGLVVAHFHELLDALAATPTTLQHSPAAVELLDKLLIDAARASPGMSRQISIIEGDPRGVLVIELYDEDATRLESRLQAVAADLQDRKMGHAWPIVTDEARQADVWNVRKAGLGLLMSKPGERHPYDFVDDTAVDPSRLRDYIARFMDILREEGVEDSSYYAHASVGCLHVKPVLNLRKLGDVRRMYRVADRISSLALEFNGSMTGEHGDGIVRSVWIEKMFGPDLVEAFRKVKSAFDPQGILNPGKIVNPLSMTENLRWQPMDSQATVPSCGEPQPSSLKSQDSSLPILDFTLHGGMQGLAEMCSGVGQCRQKLVGTMCPSYMATGDEMHTTRARANALRLALSDHSLIHGLEDPALDEVMDLCLSCKACKTECPTGVDMAKLKAEWLHLRNQRRGTPLRSQLIARLPHFARLACEFAPIVNAMSQSRIGRALGETLFGMDRRIPLPRFAHKTFTAWFNNRSNSAAPRSQAPSLKSRVCLFVDTWTNYFTPHVGIAAVRVLESLGQEVIVPEVVCCGRPGISKGLLLEAKAYAERNVAILHDYAAAGLPIICIEPSCASALMDEWPQLVRTPAARQIAKSTIMIESYLANPRLIERLQEQINRSQAASLKPQTFLYHAHCHQKALIGSQDALALLRAIGPAEEINAGCCGMAGAFGHEREHYDIARAIGEERLFPAVRKRGNAMIAVSGFSCRHHIVHHTQAPTRHVLECVDDMLRTAATD